MTTGKHPYDIPAISHPISTELPITDFMARIGIIAAAETSLGLLVLKQLPKGPSNHLFTVSLGDSQMEVPSPEWKARARYDWLLANS